MSGRLRNMPYTTVASRTLVDSAKVAPRNRDLPYVKARVLQKSIETIAARHNVPLSIQPYTDSTLVHAPVTQKPAIRSYREAGVRVLPPSGRSQIDAYYVGSLLVTRRGAQPELHCRYLSPPVDVEREEVLEAAPRWGIENAIPFGDDLTLFIGKISVPLTEEQEQSFLGAIDNAHRDDLFFLHHLRIGTPQKP